MNKLINEESKSNIKYANLNLEWLFEERFGILPYPSDLKAIKLTSFTIDLLGHSGLYFKSRYDTDNRILLKDKINNISCFIFSYIGYDNIHAFLIADDMDLLERVHILNENGFALKTTNIKGLSNSEKSLLKELKQRKVKKEFVVPYSKKRDFLRVKIAKKEKRGEELKRKKDKELKLLKRFCSKKPANRKVNNRDLWRLRGLNREIKNNKVDIDLLNYELWSLEEKDNETIAKSEAKVFDVYLGRSKTEVRDYDIYKISDFYGLKF